MPQPLLPCSFRLLPKATALQGSSFAPWGTLSNVWGYFRSPLEGATGPDWVEARAPTRHERAPLNKLSSPKGPACMVLNLGSFSSLKMQLKPNRSLCSAPAPRACHPHCGAAPAHPPAGHTAIVHMAWARHECRQQSHPGALALMLGPSPLPGRRADLTGHEDRLTSTSRGVDTERRGPRHEAHRGSLSGADHDVLALWLLVLN